MDAGVDIRVMFIFVDGVWVDVDVLGEVSSFYFYVWVFFFIVGEKVM